MRWPTWMDHLQAKSTDMGGQTLAQHTWDVLQRLNDQRRLRPHLTEHLSPRVWSQAFWGVLLHDFGKAAEGFQAVLHGRPHGWSQRKHRHEVLSLAFVDWLFPKDHPDRPNVLAIIACHHKDADELFSKYGGTVVFSQLEESERHSYKAMLNELAANITAPVRQQLWRWLDECAHDWAAALGIPLDEPPTLLPYAQAERHDLAKAIYQALRELHTIRAQSLRQALLLRGLIFTADHSASAGVTGFPALPLSRAVATRPLADRALRAHQATASHARLGSALLVAPTGSGKTEAALLWAAAQHEQRPASRLFYTLPYQASMNATYLRLAHEVLGHPVASVKAGQVETITIRHSRALLKLYQDMMDLDEVEAKAAARRAKHLRNRADLNTYPIQVFSPYQMLKVAYGLKGYEALVLDYTDALFIFDEIHAYDPKRLALIVELARWLRSEFGARFLVMTATLPPMLRDKLVEALRPQIIEADAAEFQRSQRHTVEVVAGRLSEAIVERVRADWQAGRAVLVCLNQVATAQQVYRQLRDALGLQPDDEIVLLHGRFNGRDRARKEAILMARVGVGSPTRRPLVCVATQVVEVSLNVDFDTLYTDPAPLEALLQRFGRVNRGRPTRQLLPVHVFEQPSARSQQPYQPYDPALVASSLRVLNAHCAGQPIDEAQVTALLSAIYTGEALRQWERDYEASRSAFTRDVLGHLRPFTSAEDDLRQRFYQLFDGVEVLPISLLDDYDEALDRGGYLEASQYLVNISYGVYAEFDGYGRVHKARQREGSYADHLHVDYHPEFGLDIDGARRSAKNGIGDEDV